MKKRRIPRSCELLIQSALAVMSCEATAGASVSTPDIEDPYASLDYDDEQTMRRISTVIGSTLSSMSSFEQTCAICALAADDRAEMRMLAALCLKEADTIIGGRWCMDALSSDGNELVRRACDVASAMTDDEDGSC
jgi:hypothetical protein